MLILLLLHVGPPAQPEAAALVYLAAQVPAWARANRCHACHHDGDGARALFAAGKKTASLDWLARPAKWDKNGGDGPFNDKRLARLQFAAALAEASRAGFVRGKALTEAARLVVAEQGRDGAWHVGDALGSPATWGTALATALARQTLAHLGKEHRREIARADDWLRKAEPASILDAAALLIGLGKADDAAARKQRRRCLTLLRRGEGKRGGWGPYESSPPEVFDTAVAVVALATQPGAKRMAARGRAWLLGEQQADGSWAETTRPAGAISYPQRVSTTAWAALALRATR